MGLLRNRHNTKRIFNKHDLESMRASDAAAGEIEPSRDPRCEEAGHHIANCECRGDARQPMEPAPSN